MIKALAPGMRRGCSWVWLAIALTAGFPDSTRAQDRTKSARPSTKAENKGAAKVAEKPTAKPTAKAAEKEAVKKADEPAGEDEAPTEKKSDSVEVFTDPNAEEAMNKLHSVPGLKPCPPRDVAAVKAMAAGGAVDRDVIERFVKGMAYDLTNKTNINALVAPAPNQNAGSSRGIQNATDNLVEALNTARLADNRAFLEAYNRELVETLSKLLDNHLVSRIQAMIVLGQTGSALAVPVFLSQLKDKNQTVWVQLWAVRGLSTVVDNGRRVDSVVSAQQAINAGKAIADFLEASKDLPWPAQMRALEALGAMRQAAVPNNMQKAEMSVAAMRFLADPEARPEVRAAAAWALGMLRVNPQIAKYNFTLIAYNIGQLSAEVGEQVNSAFGVNPTRSNYLTNLLVTPLFQAFHGLDGARESGLMKAPAAGPSQGLISRIADLSGSVARASVELVRAPRGQVEKRQQDLSDRVAALKSYLDKNAPKDYHLVPGAQEFRAANPQVADAPAARPRVAGAPGGR